MKLLLKNDFAAARTALLDAATAVDATQPLEAIRHLQALRNICEVMIDLLEGLPSTKAAR